MPQYVVLQVTLKEKFLGTASRNLGELESVINNQAAKGVRLHTITTASGNRRGAFCSPPVYACAAKYSTKKSRNV